MISTCFQQLKLSSRAQPGDLIRSEKATNTVADERISDHWRIPPLQSDPPAGGWNDTFYLGSCFIRQSTTAPLQRGILGSLFRITAILFFLIFFPSPLVQQADAQFVDLLLEVEPELSASVEKPLNFGTVTTNSGRKVISLGDFDMGIFSITALQNQQLALSLNFPSALENEDPSIPNVIPIDLRARYGFNRNNVRESYSITSGMTSFSMESHNGNTPWAKVFIYIFGTIQVGDIPEGTYSENIVLYVEYI